MTQEELQKINFLKFYEDWITDNKPYPRSTAVTCEVLGIIASVADVYQRAMAGEFDSQLDREKFAKEMSPHLGSILYCTTALCNSLGLNLEAIARHNYEQIEQMKLNGRRK